MKKQANKHPKRKLARKMLSNAEKIPMRGFDGKLLSISPFQSKNWIQRKVSKMRKETARKKH